MSNYGTSNCSQFQEEKVVNITKARQLLEKVKEDEREKLNAGYRYVKINATTRVLTNDPTRAKAKYNFYMENYK